MNDQQRTNRNISSGVIAAVSAAVVAVSGGVAWITSQTPNTPTPVNPSQSIRQPQQPLTTQPGNEQTASIYWLRSKETGVELVPQPLKIAAAQPNQALEKAFQALLVGPTEGTDSTTIPQGTQLLGMKVENNEVHVNLSEDFTSGGGSTSMMGRVGQVVYTATTLNPDAKVFIEVNGKPLEVLGGEGVEIEQPLTRKSFNQNYPL
ncbi:GerMN domain-containing protein [Anabaena cylindrica FACHB-243]|uniref:Lipoprotein LpqB, GerMN domain protein n=1 Tax=Anabaena cylindrica (strain ATCC 27899 / PCC 7122) TaxID=272123 RepID=K9Z9M9_ANACC|nr:MULTISPECIES: GerMN domain-containing protein [Anabaena]AFZ55876.1 Lipoprotein LpqB, GerMN domain protein [Anabaena cylindrica PCC 7122]MBD2421298.1 GerMN domain-containing protein [Anabaena cylindrica FACHB-243]MBY5280868.1 spore germination protein [Anabaena sp. CCAP 1446/1C]MBY5309993.1 spore germination protein [Anabaena sp. CCAP 1446/1C]MCM2406630.1 GerMN domain-containing protein [Anabaena sp. CCAP 1446/1C]